MNLIHSRPPHVRSHESNFSVMGDMVISLVPLYLMAYFFYGSRTLVLGAVSVITCTVLDFLCTFLSSRRVGILDLSPVVTGLLIPLMLPASIGFTPVIAADLFAIGVIKQPFGGLGQNIFNPAAGGVAFAVLTWSDSVFRYPVPIESLGNAAPGWFLLRLLRCGWAQPRTIPLPIFSWASIPGRWAGPAY